VAQAIGRRPKKLADRAKRMHEFNPMLGFRAAVLLLPILKSPRCKARAIFEAAVEASRDTGKRSRRKSWLPLIASKIELDIVKERIDAMAEKVAARTNLRSNIKSAHDRTAARGADGRRDRRDGRVLFVRHNDLTQTAFRHHRDDAASFLGIYTSKGILPATRFVSIDREGVVNWPHRQPRAARKVRQGYQARHLRRTRRRPASVAFCHEVGLITCPARRFACRSRGWPPRKRRLGKGACRTG